MFTQEEIDTLYKTEGKVAATLDEERRRAANAQREALRRPSSPSSVSSISRIFTALSPARLFWAETATPTTLTPSSYAPSMTMSTESLSSLTSQPRSMADSLPLPAGAVIRTPAEWRAEFNSRVDNINQLTVMLSPPRQIPEDVLLKIFTLVTLLDADGPLLLLEVSRAWRDLALHTPTLWSTITIDATVQGWKERADAYVTLSAHTPLSVIFEGAMPDPSDLVFLQGSLSRWTALAVVSGRNTIVNAALSAVKHIAAGQSIPVSTLSVAADPTEEISEVGPVLAACRNLRQVEFGGNQFPAEALNRSTGLRQLRLNVAKIEDGNQLFEILANNKELREITILGGNSDELSLTVERKVEATLIRTFTASLSNREASWTLFSRISVGNLKNLSLKIGFAHLSPVLRELAAAQNLRRLALDIALRQGTEPIGTKTPEEKGQLLCTELSVTFDYAVSDYKTVDDTLAALVGLMPDLHVISVKRNDTPYYVLDGLAFLSACTKLESLHTLHYHLPTQSRQKDAVENPLRLAALKELEIYESNLLDSLHPPLLTSLTVHNPREGQVVYLDALLQRTPLLESLTCYGLNGRLASPKWGSASTNLTKLNKLAVYNPTNETVSMLFDRMVIPAVTHLTVDFTPSLKHAAVDFRMRFFESSPPLLYIRNLRTVVIHDFGFSGAFVSLCGKLILDDRLCPVLEELGCWNCVPGDWRDLFELLKRRNRAHFEGRIKGRIARVTIPVLPQDKILTPLKELLKGKMIEMERMTPLTRGADCSYCVTAGTTCSGKQDKVPHCTLWDADAPPVIVTGDTVRRDGEFRSILLQNPGLLKQLEPLDTAGRSCKSEEGLNDVVSGSSDSTRENVDPTQ